MLNPPQLLQQSVARKSGPPRIGENIYAPLGKIGWKTPGGPHKCAHREMGARPIIRLGPTAASCFPGRFAKREILDGGQKENTPHIGGVSLPVKLTPLVVRNHLPLANVSKNLRPVLPQTPFFKGRGLPLKNSKDWGKTLFNTPNCGRRPLKKGFLGFQKGPQIKPSISLMWPPFPKIRLKKVSKKKS